MPSTKVVQKPEKGTGEEAITIAVVELADVKKADLGDLANAVANCNTPHKAKVAPAASLVLFGKDVDKETASAVSKALAKVKGVDAKEVKADAKKGEVTIPLKKAEKKKDQAALKDVLAAVEDLGLKLSKS